MGRRLQGVWIAIMIWLAGAIALWSYRYLIPGTPSAPANVLANRFTPVGALALHSGLAATALLIGPWQFVRRLRSRWPRAHRWIGTAYVAGCLGGGAAGLVLALGTTAGPVASAGFGLLALTWLGVTWRAWRLARAHAYAAHRRWMIRSYALTLAAVSLRLLLPGAAIAGLDMAVAYPAISFLCWVPNLLIAELLLARLPALAPA